MQGSVSPIVIHSMVLRKWDPIEIQFAVRYRIFHTVGLILSMVIMFGSNVQKGERSAGLSEWSAVAPRWEPESSISWLFSMFFR